MSRDKRIIMTPREVQNLKDEVTNKCIVLMAACAMDSLGLNKEQIKEFAEDFQRYSKAVESHIISLKVVQNILHEELGIEIKSWQ